MEVHAHNQHGKGNTHTHTPTQNGYFWNLCSIFRLKMLFKRPFVRLFFSCASCSVVVLLCFAVFDSRLTSAYKNTRKNVAFVRLPMRSICLPLSTRCDAQHLPITNRILPITVNVFNRLNVNTRAFRTNSQQFTENNKKQKNNPFERRRRRQ